MPYPHILIDRYFNEAYARELLAEFPSFDRRAVIEDARFCGTPEPEFLRDIGPAYATLDHFFGSREFSHWAAQITSIDGLRYDPEDRGGGIYEFFQDQGLAPGVGFNYHPKTHFQRRLHLILFLNHDWRQEWGGALQLYAAPIQGERRAAVSYPPAFNRCIIFETSDRSWYGFETITLPRSLIKTSLKLLSIYFYAAEKTAGSDTLYFPRSLPTQIQLQRRLTPDDIKQLESLVRERNELIELLRSNLAVRESGFSGTPRPGNARVPLLGYVRQIGKSKGMYEDGWAAPVLEFCIEAQREVIGFTIRAHVHESVPRGTFIEVRLDQERLCNRRLEPGTELREDCRGAIAAGSKAAILITCSDFFRPIDVGLNDDARTLGLFLRDITFEHVPPQDAAAET